MARAALPPAVIALVPAVAGCAPPPYPAEETDAGAAPWTAADLWRGAVGEGSRVEVGPLVVTSPRERDGLAFYAAAPGGGPRSGVRIVLGQVIDDWPPAEGAPFTVTGTVVQEKPPVVWVAAEADFEALDGDVAPVAPAPVPTDGAGLQELRFAVVVARGIEVTSVPDPLGNADGTGIAIGGRFGLVPGYRRTGDLTGILGDDLRLSARTAADWTGDWPSDPPLPAPALDKLDGIPAGTPLVLPDLVQATPWSRDLRWTVIQDADGVGVWLDGEGWGLWGKVGQGAHGTWTAEVRYDEFGVHLRTWIPPRVRGTAPIVVGKDLVDGALVWFAAPEVGPADAYGERTAGDLVLDDRFLDLAAVEDGAAIAGVGAVRGGVVAPVLLEVR